MAFMIVSSAILSGLLLVRVKMTRRFDSPQQLPVTAEWIDEISIDRYRPMLRLLDQADFRFLRTQPGFTPKMAKKLRTQRCRIFRAYLRNLDNDFKRICTALKVLMAQSKHDRPDLASALVANQMRFSYGIMIAQVKLVCYRCGLGTVKASGLLRLFDGMRLELRTRAARVS
jgi:hypothetical protein